MTSSCSLLLIRFGLCPVHVHVIVSVVHSQSSVNILWNASLSSICDSNYSRRVVVSYKRKYVHEVLVNCLLKLAQEKVWLG